MKNYKNTIVIAEKEFNLHVLTSIEVMEALTLAKNFKQELLSVNFHDDEIDEALIDALCEYSVLIYYCLWKDNKNAFTSPFEVLKAFTIDELCDIYDTYAKLCVKSTDEYSVNESFTYPVSDITEEIV